MKLKIQYFICFLFGHKWRRMDGYDNGYSRFSDWKCDRCNKLKTYHYDYFSS